MTVDKEPPVLDRDAYFAEAESFYEEGYRRIKASRDRAWIVAAAASALAGLGMLAVAFLAPLKRTDVVPVVVDRSTGEAHIETQLTSQTISQQEAVRKADLASYVIARESFDRALVNQFYGTVQGRSTEAVLKPWLAQFQSGAPDSIYVRYRDATRNVEVRGVVLLSDGVGQVHFNATLIRQNAAPVSEDFIATVEFRYSAEGMGFAQRLRNPLGFVVTAYRVDQESLSKEGRP
ncbi:MAG: type IV secretion system protein [Nevskia sp.]|nr:type IV secretion system protein [Nevskia sp.]